MKNKVIALLVSDIHLSLEPPIARCREQNWLEAQAYDLRQLKTLQEKHDCPVIIAGDIFHRWKSPPELINFALEELPDKCYAIPGQHDLPFHSLEDLHRSSFGTLVKAKKINLLRHGRDWIGVRDSFISIFGFPWGTVPKGDEKRHSDSCLSLAVIHAYCWNDTKNKYPGAPKTGHVNRFKLKPFNVALFGDNHRSFVTIKNRCTVFNHGCFIRRTTDEYHACTPAIGLLYDDGSIGLHNLDTSREVWDLNGTVVYREQTELKIKKLSKILSNLGDHSEDFERAVETYIRQESIPTHTAKVIKQTLDELRRTE